MTTNPYSTHAGYGLRYLRAKAALTKFGGDPREHPGSREFDNCFENYDGDAVVWQLMHDLIRGDSILEQGIRRMGGRLFADWMNIYDRSNHDRAQRYFDFLTEEQKRKEIKNDN